MKTGILITARLKSTRLPKKVLLPIKGRPLLSHLLDRLRLCPVAETIVLCTSPVAQDDELAQYGEACGLPVFRGDPDDVLLRMRDAARQFNLDQIISCTADNPFVDPDYAARLLRFHVAEGNDFTKINGLPFGTFSYALRLAAVERACELKGTNDTEVWGGYFTQTGRFKCGALEVTDAAVRWPELRLTVDTPEDFKFVEEIFDRLYGAGRVFALREIVDLCRQHPELLTVNAHVKQKPGNPIVLKQPLA